MYMSLRAKALVVLSILLLIGSRTRNNFYAPTAITPSVKNALEMFLNGIHHKQGESDKKYSKKKKKKSTKSRKQHVMSKLPLLLVGAYTV